MIPNDEKVRPSVKRRNIKIAGQNDGLCLYIIWARRRDGDVYIESKSY